MSVPELLTPRLRLRGWRAEDIEPMATINADPRVGEWLGGAIGREQTEARLYAYAYHWEERGFGLWAVEERATGPLVGRTGLMHWDDWDRLCCQWTAGNPRSQPSEFRDGETDRDTNAGE